MEKTESAPAFWVGMKLYKIPRDRRGKMIMRVDEVTVEFIGRKYLTLEDNQGSKIEKESLQHVSNSSCIFNYQLYRNRKEAEETLELENLKDKIRGVNFNQLKNLETLRELCKVLGI